MADHLIEELKHLVIDVCNLEAVQISADQIDPAAPLVGPDSALGIDSLDSIEIVAAVQKKYNLRIDNINIAREILKTIDSLAGFIRREKASA